MSNSVLSFKDLHPVVINKIKDDVSKLAQIEKEKQLRLEELNNNVALKKQFAEALLRNPKDRYSVAREIFPNDIGCQAYVSASWPEDPEVLQLQEELLTEFGKEYFLPDKDDIAREVYERSMLCRNMDDFAKGMKLYCDVRGFIEKPGNTINNNVSLVSNVMQVPVIETENDWERHAKLQQQKLKTICIEQSAAEKDDSESA